MREKTEECISVIVPIYNTEKYLDACIQSLVNQSYPNLEIILVDDGSTDKSGQICDSWAIRDIRIKVVHQSNRGLSDARNHGVSVSCGRYISFVDSDDWLDKDFYQVLLAELLENDADIAASGVKRIYQNGEQAYPGSTQKIYTPDEAMETVITGTVFTVMVCNKLFKREFVIYNLFPTGRFHEDDFVMYKIITSCNKLVFLSDVFYYYRQRKHGTIGSGLKHRFEDKYGSYFQNADIVKKYFPQLTWMMKRLLCQYAVNDYTLLFGKLDKESRKMKRQIRSWCKSVHFSTDEWNRMSSRDRKFITRSLRCLRGYCGYLALLKNLRGNRLEYFE